MNTIKAEIERTFHMVAAPATVAVPVPARPVRELTAEQLAAIKASGVPSQSVTRSARGRGVRVVR